jgi:TBC1 domain family protein 5
MPENLYFRQPSTQKILLDVLFVFCKLNGDVSYRQGMHELLAPILWVVERDAIAPESVDASRHTAESEELLKEILDARFIEHDSFTLFSLVMQTAKSFYELDNQSQSQPVASSASSATGTSSPKGSPIVERSKHIHENCLAKVDPGLADRLRELDVLPQVFLM